MVFNPMWIPAGIGAASQLAGMFGGDEYEQPQWYQQQLPEWAAPEMITGRPAEWYQAPTYPWAEGLLGRGAGLLGELTTAAQRGQIPPYLTEMGEALRRPAMGRLRETYFGTPEAPGVAQLAGEAAAGARLGRGGRQMAGMQQAARGFGREAAGIESQIAQLLGQETAGLYRQLPSWLGTYGQIRPAAQYQPPAERWWEPAVYGFQGAPMGGGQQPTGGFDIGQMLPWLMQGQGGGAQGGTYTGWQPYFGGGQTWSPYGGGG